MDVREKLVELAKPVLTSLPFPWSTVWRDVAEKIAEAYIANGVTVQKHGYLETVVEVKDNTVCGNGVKIEYKRCSCCKNPPKFWGDNFCGHCGAKLDLPQPPKGE